MDLGDEIEIQFLPVVDPINDFILDGSASPTDFGIPIMEIVFPMNDHLDRTAEPEEEYDPSVITVNGIRYNKQEISAKSSFLAKAIENQEDEIKKNWSKPRDGIFLHLHSESCKAIIQMQLEDRPVMPNASSDSIVLDMVNLKLTMEYMEASEQLRGHLVQLISQLDPANAFIIAVWTGLDELKERLNPSAEALRQAINALSGEHYRFSVKHLYEILGKIYSLGGSDDFEMLEVPVPNTQMEGLTLEQRNKEEDVIDEAGNKHLVYEEGTDTVLVHGNYRFHVPKNLKNYSVFENWFFVPAVVENGLNHYQLVGKLEPEYYATIFSLAFSNSTFIPTLAYEVKPLVQIGQTS